MPEHVPTQTSESAEMAGMAKRYADEVRAIFGLFSLVLVGVLLFVAMAMFII